MRFNLFYSRFKSNKRDYKISFSQSGEDLIIEFFFKVIGIDKPSYLDIGAHHPYYLNNTAIFYQNGSSGVNIEPDKRLFKKFQKYRKRDINLNIAISDVEGVIPMFLMSSPALNTTSREEAIEMEKNSSARIKEEVEVTSISINSVLAKYFNHSCPDFISIDIEGLDYQVISSMDFSVWKPKLICVESLKFCQSGFGSKDSSIAKLLVENGYSVYGETYLNTIFVQSKFLRI